MSRALKVSRRKKIEAASQKFGGDRIKIFGSSLPNCASECASMQQAADRGQAYNPSLNWVLPLNRDKVRSEYATASENRYHWRTNKDHYNEYRQKMIESSIHANKQAQQEIAAYRRFEITSDLQPSPFALGLFQSINLSEDELPMMVTPAARQYFNVRYLGQDGGARQAQWTSSDSATTLEMRQIGTDKVEYSLRDIQEGRLNQAANVNTQLRYDMDWKIEDFARATVDASIVTSGLQDAIQIHPKINRDNLPDSNYLDLTDPSYGTPGVLTIARLKAILAHMSLWSTTTSPDGPINIQSMIMSPQNRMDSWDYVDLVSGWDSSGETWDNDNVGPGGLANPQNTVTTAQREQIFSSGNHMAGAWGMSWLNQYNDQLDRGRLYVTTNQPLGWYFTKTAFDQFITWDGQPDNIAENYGQAMMTKVLLFATTLLWANRILIVDF